MSSPDYMAIGSRMHSRREDLRNIPPALISTLHLLQRAQLERSLNGGEWVGPWSDNREDALLTLCAVAIEHLYGLVDEIVGEDNGDS